MGIADYNTVAADNTAISGINIAEGCPPSGINNAIRQMMADIATDVPNKNAVSNYAASQNWAQAPDIASAATVNLGAAAGNYAHITGTVTIGAFDTIQAGTTKTVKFTGILQLTNSGALALPGGANITTAAGDTAVFVSEGSGNWVCTAYQPASGLSVVSPQGVPTGAMFQFPATAAPAGYLECNGSLVSRTTYAALWTFAQASSNIVADGSWDKGMFSTGDGSTTFRIPDMRGYVPRGWDHSSGVDSGRAIGTLQTDAIASHSVAVTISDPGHAHNIVLGGDGPAAGTVPQRTINSLATAVTNTATTGITASGAYSGASETRVKNVALLWAIKT